jgi:hypothetical protein
MLHPQILFSQEVRRVTPDILGNVNLNLARGLKWAKYICVNLFSLSHGIKRWVTFYAGVMKLRAGHATYT